MRELGLHMNVGKTDVLEGDDLKIEARRLEHSAVDGALAEPAPDGEPLQRLVERLLDRPEHADRTSIRFATVRMRKHGLFEKVEDFVEKAPRMPQAADALARLFRDSEAWRDLADWYVAYASSAWATMDWSVGQMGTMFPSQSRGPRSLRDFFGESLANSTSLMLTALCSQRLAAWDRDTARFAIGEKVNKSAHHLERRVLALAALGAGESRQRVRAWLSELPENAPTNRMLDDLGFRVPLKADFEGT